MHATSIPQTPQYFSQPNYTFYYTNSGRYCAYDPVSRNHFIHSLNDNRWYPYFPVAETMPGIHLKSHGHYAPHDATYDHRHMRESGCRENGEGYHGRDRSREHLFYTTAAAESARRSLIEEDVEMDHVYEEDLNAYGGADWWNSSTFKHNKKTRGYKREEPSHSRRYHRVVPETSQRHQHFAQPPRHHQTHEDSHRDETRHRSHRRKHRQRLHSSKRAYVEGPGSDHDSGYFEDFEPCLDPRDAMPGIARWLDSLEEEAVYDDERWHQFDPEERFFEEHGPYYPDGEYSSHSRGGPRRPMKERSHNSQPLPPKGRDNHPINIEINLGMDDMDYDNRHQQQTFSKQRRDARHRTAYEGRENVVYHDGQDYDYYYEIPSAPPPPPVDRAGRTPTKSRTIYHPNSIYSGPESVKMPGYASGLPRAPSPPPSPPPQRRRTTGGERVRYVRPDSNLRGRRAW